MVRAYCPNIYTVPSGLFLLTGQIWFKDIIDTMKVQFTLETEALVEEFGKAKFDQEVFVCLLHLRFLAWAAATELCSRNKQKCAKQKLILTWLNLALKTFWRNS